MTQEKTQGRIEMKHEAVKDRIRHFREFVKPLTEKEAVQQAGRCLNCGTPYCAGECPLGNRPVDFNRLARDGRWHAAWEALTATNPFPEFTSRVCPALCESACTRNLLEGAAVGIRSVERVIVDRAWKSGWVTPLPALQKTGKCVAVVGSGPAGLACAQQLARAGHDVTVFEKSAKAGGLLRYGIPNFKLDKSLIDRRLAQMSAEGVVFKTSTAVGVKTFETGIRSEATAFVTADDVCRTFNAVVLAAGAETPRDWALPGRKAKGVHFAMELLADQNGTDEGAADSASNCRGCDVVVLGGGDTGSDCIGIARRQGARRIVQVARSPEPRKTADLQAAWPKPAAVLKTSTSQEEGCERLWGLAAKEFLTDDKGAVRGVRFARLKWDWNETTGRREAKEVPGETVDVPAQRVFLAIGFTRPSASLLKAFGVAADEQGNAKAQGGQETNPFGSTAKGVFVCGDIRRGQSLVARALREGRYCADAVNAFLSEGTPESV